jgi:methionyl-tRNA formyltransferase
MQELSGIYGFQFILTDDTSLNSLMDILRLLDFDILISNGWQFKLSGEICALSKIESLNCHSSYLPEYRGGNVTFAPLINEEKESGVTVHTIENTFDSGMILAQQRVPVYKGDTPGSLNLRRAEITGRVLKEALRIAGEKEKYKQNPPSPFYLRCSHGTYRKLKYVNFFRKLVRLPVKKYEPVYRNDI